ncbi:transcription factor SPT20, partial [Phenoliferia sp. Uapishka_3]
MLPRSDPGTEVTDRLTRRPRRGGRKVLRRLPQLLSLPVSHHDLTVIETIGCLIVEVHDHRSAPLPTTATRTGIAFSIQHNPARDAPIASKAEIFRIVLAPNPSTLWTQLGILERRDEATKEGDQPRRSLTEEEAVEVEAVILECTQARTSAPLCLSPSLQTTRIANMMHRATASRPHKRKRFCHSGEGDEDEDGEEATRKEREEREKIMKIGDEGVGRGRGHAFARLAFIQAYRERTNNPHGATTGAPAAPATSTTTSAPPLPTSSSGVTLRLAGPTASSVSTPNGGAGSPPATGVARPKKKTGLANATESDGTPGPSTAVATPPYPAKLTKKQTAAALKAGIAYDVNDPALPQNSAEKERILVERIRLITAQQKKDAKAKAKEKKRLEAVGGVGTPGLSADLQVATPSAAAPTPAARFAWSGGP